MNTAAGIDGRTQVMANPIFENHEARCRDASARELERGTGRGVRHRHISDRFRLLALAPGKASVTYDIRSIRLTSPTNSGAGVAKAANEPQVCGACGPSESSARNSAVCGAALTFSESTAIRSREHSGKHRAASRLFQQRILAPEAFGQPEVFRAIRIGSTHK